MTAFRVEFLFEIGKPPAQFCVTKDTLGKSYSLSHDDLPIQIDIPRRSGDFLFWTPFIPGEYHALSEVGAWDEVFVHIILVTVIIDAEVSAIAATIENADALNRAVAMMDTALDVASHVVTEFVAWVRATTRMTSLPLSSEVPPLAGPVRAFEVDSGRQLRVGPSHRTVAVARDPAGKYHLTAPDLEQIVERVNRGHEAPVAETLLADAEYYARYEVRDYRRAVLMAAIACEVKVKAILRDRALAEQKPLVDFALDNPREVTVTAASGLYDKLMLATLGRSLRRDDRQLFRDIEHLYTVRNNIAHRGAVPSEADAGRAVRGARRCFVWLDSLPEPQSSERG
jgi:hypothetical protein